MRIPTLPALLVMVASAGFPSAVPAAATEARSGVAAEVSAALPRSFDAGWRFAAGDLTGAEKPGYADTGWRVVDLPHDWSIEPGAGGALHDRDMPDGQSVGYLRGGVGWYRKHFVLEASDSGREVDVVFDGVQQDADVWLNGHYLGFQPHGYVAFHFPLGAFLNGAGGDNVLAVRAVNPESNSRWYAGSGLYRQVSLRVHDPLHVPVWGARIDTVWIHEDKALLQFRLDVSNDRTGPEDLAVEVSLTGPDGVTEEHSLGKAHVAPGATERISESLQVSGVHPWSPERPDLYRAEFRIVQGGRVVDAFRQAFGIRTISVSAQTGLLVNGQPTKLRGGCLHHDNGLLGSAAFPDAEERRVRLMKECGYNAIRTSHNPPSTAFLDACDRLGMLVVDEFADSWELPKKPNGYTRYFDGHWDHDLGAMIARDFNHPSVVIWSIGNEIPERGNPAGLAIGQRLAAFVRGQDPRRPVTNAICGGYDEPGKEGQWDIFAPAIAFLDVGGYNYFLSKYESDHERFPARVMMGTESFPKEALENWTHVDRDPYVIGDFVWTGMDYIGESGIGHATYESPSDDPKSRVAEYAQMPWPWWVSWCGDLDITGVKKPQSYYRDVVWSRSPVELEVHEPVPAGKSEKVGLWGWPAELPSWTWRGAEGKTLDVNVYTRAESVRLELNGKVVGERAVDPARGITASFSVAYEPGTLRAVAVSGGKVVATGELTTAGPAVAVKVAPESARAPASRQSLVYVPVEAVDAKGSRVPDSSCPLTVAVEGPAQLLAFGTGCPTDLAAPQGPTATAFRGRALAILRSTGKPGRVTVTVRGPGLAEGSATFEFEAGN